MKKTKIVASIGPASNGVKIFSKMALAGVNVARINFSHATLKERKKAVATVKEARELTGKNIAIMYDTKGPEFRCGSMPEEGIKLLAGKTIKIVKKDIIGTSSMFTVNYKDSIDYMNIGDTILLENGLMKIEVISKEKDYVNCKIINGGTLYSKKSLAVPGVNLNIPFISNEDREDIIYACRHEGDYLAASFVENKENILEIRKILEEEKRQDLKIIAKIESLTGMNNLESIAECADGLMVARGDLGVEAPFEELPLCEKRIIEVARKYRKPVIVATEMLESMKHNIRPTRAEVTDISYAVFNGTDAVMLSGETTTGEYPIETVSAMARICEHIENSIDYDNKFAEKKVTTATDATIKAVVDAANSLNAKLIVVPTLTGTSARYISNLEPICPILALVKDEHTANILSLNYGVYSKKTTLINDMDKLVNLAVKEAKKFTKLEKGDNIIITGGLSKGKIGFTNLMKIETINIIK